MTKIKTIDQLQTSLEEDLVWRKRELVIIKSLVTQTAPTDIVSCYVRSGIALLYAHWEGFIKEAGTLYLTYIASQRLTYSELSHNFLAVAMKRHFRDAEASHTIGLYVKVTEIFLSRLTERCHLPTEIETKSNLSSEVLKEITMVLGLNHEEYAKKAQIIDELLVSNRNKVSHGEKVRMDVSEFISLHRTIINLLELFSNQIINAALLGSYRRVPVERV